MSLPSTRYRVIDCAWSASTTFDAVSSITEATSSLLGAGFEMILIRRERLRAVAIAGASIGVCRDWHRPGAPATENGFGLSRISHFPCLGPHLPKNHLLPWPTRTDIHFSRG